MGSSRLPCKVLLPALGKPMLAHQIDRLRQISFADEIVIATTHSVMDDEIVRFCDQYGVSSFRGDEHDVLSRYAGAALQYKADVVVRLTSDCPLIDPAVVERVISCYREKMGTRVYVSNTLSRTFPRGMDAEVFSSELLFEADRKAITKHDREHVTPFLIRNDQNDISQYNVEHYKNLSAYRLTLDYAKDYKQILGIMGSGLPDYSLDTVIFAAASNELNFHDNAEVEQEQEQEQEQEDRLLTRFGLGTAQFGMYYGQFNRDGVPSIKTVCEIVRKSASLGLSCIDTAHLYGQSEAVLGHCENALSSFSIITKTPRFSDARINKQDALNLRSAFEMSLMLMRRNAIDGLLIHHAPNLLTDGGELLYQEMVKLKKEGKVRRIGVSAYSGEVVEKIHEKFPLDFVQLPINLLDRRLTEGGDLKRLSGLGIKIHARSAFLQGLLLANPDTLSAHFNPVKEVLRSFHAAAHRLGVSPAHAALHYLLRLPEIEKIIVGVESLSQFESLFDDFPAQIEMNFDEYRVDRVDILNPVLWLS